MTREKCEELFWSRSFIFEPNHRPTLIYTYPGSGTTMTQLLVEYATGYYTGSMYNEGKTMTKILPGEIVCNRSVVLAKMHPPHCNFSHLKGGYCGMKCLQGGLNSSSSYKGALLLIRNPYDAIWSEYERSRTGSHTGRITEEMFDRSHFLFFADLWARQYNNMMKYDYVEVEKSFGSYGTLYVRYEDIIKKENQVKILRNIVKFLGFEVNPDRIKCAFILCDRPETHRTEHPEREVMKDDVYDLHLACHLYDIFKETVSKHDYTVWKNFNCTNQLPVKIPSRPQPIKQPVVKPTKQLVMKPKKSEGPKKEKRLLLSILLSMTNWQ